MIILYNALNCLMWLTVLINHDRVLLQTVQLVGLIDIVLAGFRLIKSNPVVVAKQIVSRVAIILLTDYAANKYVLSGLCIAWGIADSVRYFHQIYNIDFLRYNLFYVLYPVGITFELLCYYYYSKYPIVNDMFALILAVYLIYGPGMYNHMIIQRRKKNIIQLLEKNTGNEDKTFLIRYDNKNYNTNFVNTDGAKLQLRDIIPHESIKLDENKDKTAHVLKDLGLQVSWRGVFICEYFGPLIIPLILFPTYNISSVLWSAHYIKRIYESIYIHSFSNSYMPFSNLFKNSLYYWGASYYIARDTFNLQQPLNIISLFIIGLWIYAEIVNFKCHSYLAGLRTGIDNAKYKLPAWGPFKYVACPNYTYEIISWIAFTCLTRSYMSLFFTIIGAIQMTMWARKKYIRNKKLFGEEYTIKYLILYGAL